MMPDETTRVPAIASRALVQEILAGYRLKPWGLHGLGHWARVMVNGLLLARETGADREVVALFALFHDARRRNDHRDPEHGPRGAELAGALHGSSFTLGADRLGLLQRACEGHTHEADHDDQTIKTCWDSDRLDLNRVWKRPRPKYLCTEAARRADTIEQAMARTWDFPVEDFVRTHWGDLLG